MECTAAVGALTVADRDHGVGLFDEAIDGQGRAAHELVVLDLTVERVLAPQMGVAGKVPGDVVGQAAQDPFVIAVAEASK
jgi:hypothetical protein